MHTKTKTVRASLAVATLVLVAVLTGCSDTSQEAQTEGEIGDPTGDTFQEQNPDLNVFVLPDDGLMEEPAPAPSVTIDQAREASAALVEKVRLIGERLGVRDDPLPGWARTPSLDYEPQASLSGNASPNTPADAQAIAGILTELGWDAAARPDGDVVWVDAHAGAEFVRVTVFEGSVRVVAEGAALGLDEATVDELIGKD